VGSTIFITGTGTGVGKTVLTALLTVHLRASGVRALAMKPYCSGSLDDSKLLEAANGGGLSLRQITPVFCAKPLAPIAALERSEALDALREAKRAIAVNREECEVLIVEGIGGAAVPLAPSYSVGDLIAENADHQLIVGKNRLGIINEIILTNYYLEGLGKSGSTVVLMGEASTGFSAKSNSDILKEVLKHSHLAEIPFLGMEVSNIEEIKGHQIKISKTLAQICNWVKFISADRRSCNKLQLKAKTTNRRG
jgi:dethiobiotin synthetase